MQDSFSESPEGEGLEAVKGFVSLAMRWFTTTLSIGLVIGIVFWSYRLGVRDASELPVIRAMNEPARTRPEDPGGEIADNQGLEVNEVLAGEEASIPTGSRTAPPPVALIDEDRPPVVQDIPKGNDPVVVFDPFANKPDTEESEPEDRPGIIVIGPPQDRQTDDQAAREREEAARLAREQAEREEAERLAREQAEREEQERLAREAAEREQAERAAREQAAREEQNAAQAAERRAEQERQAAEIARREQEAREIQEALERALREQQETERPPAQVTVNPNVRVQLGSFDTETAALGHLQELTSVHGDLLASRRISVQKVTAGNRVEYRIRASGFRGADETAALCQALRARGVDCVQIGG